MHRVCTVRGHSAYLAIPIVKVFKDVSRPVGVTVEILTYYLFVGVLVSVVATAHFAYGLYVMCEDRKSSMFVFLKTSSTLYFAYVFTTMLAIYFLLSILLWPSTALALIRRL